MKSYCGIGFHHWQPLILIFFSDCGYPVRVRRSKFNNRKVEIDGYKFDSVKESKRYLLLRYRLALGEINDLRIHPRIPLIVNGKKIGHYVGDFQYLENGKLILEDVKTEATKTAVYQLKKKILLAQSRPIKITEVM